MRYGDRIICVSTTGPYLTLGKHYRAFSDITKEMDVFSTKGYDEFIKVVNLDGSSLSQNERTHKYFARRFIKAVNEISPNTRVL